MGSDPKSVVRALVDAYNVKSLERLSDLYAEDAFIWHPLHRDGVRGREAIIGLVRGFFNAFPDEQVSIRALAADETTAVAEYRSTGTTAAGKTLEIEFTEVYEIAAGTIRSCRVYLDPAALPGSESTVI
jgi:ketosteroid isomerase-like protein